MKICYYSTLGRLASIFWYHSNAVLVESRDVRHIWGGTSHDCWWDGHNSTVVRVCNTPCSGFQNGNMHDRSMGWELCYHIWSAAHILGNMVEHTWRARNSTCKSSSCSAGHYSTSKRHLVCMIDAAIALKCLRLRTKQTNTDAMFYPRVNFGLNVRGWQRKSYCLVLLENCAYFFIYLFFFGNLIFICYLFIYLVFFFCLAFQSKERSFFNSTTTIIEL